MTALPPAPGVVESRAFFTLAGQSVSFRYFFFRPTTEPWGEDDINLLNSTFLEAVEEQLMPVLSEDLVVVEAQSTDLTSMTGLRVSETTNVAGTVAEHSVPLNVAVRATFIVPLRYRGGKGGIFIPGAPVTVQSNARLWTSDFQTAILDAVQLVSLNTVTADYESGNPAQVVPNYWVYGAKPPELRPAAETNPVISWEVQQRIASRRRRLGRGIAGG